MAMKHRITINVTDPNGKKAAVLRGADMKLPARLVRFLFGDFQHQFIMYLKQDRGMEPVLPEFRRQPDHGRFQNICRRPLDRSINGFPFFTVT